MAYPQAKHLLIGSSLFTTNMQGKCRGNVVAYRATDLHDQARSSVLPPHHTNGLSIYAQTRHGLELSREGKPIMHRNQLVVCLIAPITLTIFLIGKVFLPLNQTTSHNPNSILHSSASTLGHPGVKSKLTGIGDLVYGNGPVIHSPNVYAIFWGPASEWTTPGVSSGVIQFFKDVSGSSFENVLTQYYDINGVHLTNSSPLIDTYYDTSPVSTYCSGNVFDERQMKMEVSNVVYNKGWPSATNNIYFLFLPSGYSAASTCVSAPGCGAHTTDDTDRFGLPLTTVKPMAYIAYPTTVPDPKLRGNCYANQAQTISDSLSNAAAHELFETITDPDPSWANGWYDHKQHLEVQPNGKTKLVDNGEIGDKCSDEHRTYVTIGSHNYTGMQAMYSNASHSCVPGDPSPTPTPLPTTTTAIPPTATPPPPTATPIPPANPAYNYMINGDFENGNTGWNVWPGMAGTDGDASTNGNWTPPGPQSGNFERIHYKAANFEVSTYSNVLTLPQPGWYTVSGWFRTSGNPSTGSVFVVHDASNLDSQANWVGSQILPTGLGNWTQYNITVQMPSTQMIVEVYTKACGGCWTTFDNLTVNPNFTPPAQPPTATATTTPITNLAVNGGFDNGSSNWNVWPGSNYTTYGPGVTGNDPYQGTGFGATNTSQSGGGIYQDISQNINPGDTFCASSEVVTQGASGGASGNFYLFLDGGTTESEGMVRASPTCRVVIIGSRNKMCVTATVGPQQLAGTVLSHPERPNSPDGCSQCA